MQRIHLVCLSVLIFSLAATSQTKYLTIEDATSQNPRLSTTSLQQLQWLTNSDTYLYIAGNALNTGNPGSI
ncbi:MAG: hypothetical protein WCL00_14060, partial [Bacteroidota bacterium]